MSMYTNQLYTVFWSKETHTHNFGIDGNQLKLCNRFGLSNALNGQNNGIPQEESACKWSISNCRRMFLKSIFCRA